MKKLIIVLFSVFISMKSYGGVFNETICFEIDGQNIVYLINETKPYTGKYLCKYDNGQKEKEGKYKDGKLIGKEPGGQLHGHSDDNAIGSVIQNAVFHDEGGSGDGFFFEGLIDEVWILNEALTAEDLKVRTVEPMDKLTVTWSAIKVQLEFPHRKGFSLQ